MKELPAVLFLLSGAKRHTWGCISEDRRYQPLWLGFHWIYTLPWLEICNVWMLQLITPHQITAVLHWSGQTNKRTNLNIFVFFSNVLTTTSSSTSSFITFVIFPVNLNSLIVSFHICGQCAESQAETLSGVHFRRCLTYWKYSVWIRHGVFPG